MARLVDDLLDVGRAVTGKIVLQRRAVNLAESVKTSITTLTSGDQQHGRIHLVTEPVWVHGDAVRLEQIVGNLISNALKFSQGELPVGITVSAEDNQAVLRVSDQGVGIPANMLPKVFDLFVQAHHTVDRSRGGLGIGLTLVRRLAELHGGTIQAASDGENRGATFTLRLPRVVAPPETAPASIVAGNGAAQAGHESRRVLLVDDNHDSREMYRTLLRACGHEVREAADGEHALAQLQGGPLDVAFLDIGLPGGMDGYELARRIRQHPLGHHVRLVALTGYGFPEDRYQSRLAGFARHLVKPVEPEVLQRELNAARRVPDNYTRKPR
jgi:CheY-like chemotaxis protein/anti-sigma regulatory factor (Ser/Thr protein kinase)